MRINKTTVAAALGITAMLGAAAPANAVATLWLQDNAGNTLTVVDGDANDSSNLAGVVVYTGALGSNWFLNVSTGISDSPTVYMDLNSVNRSAGAGSLVIRFGDTNFTLGTGPVDLAITESIGGTTGGTIQWATWLDATNTNPTQLATQACAVRGPAGPGAFSSTTTCNLTDAPTLFGLGQGVLITHTGAAVTSFDFELKVPEPASLALLGMGLLGLGASMRRKKA